jgi:Sulfotransferase family
MSATPSERGEVGGIFVAGCPRSGNTMLGEWLGSTSRVAYLGEYYAFSFAFHHTPRHLASARSMHASKFIDRVKRAAFESASEACAKEGKRHFCDSTPWNLVVMQDLLAFRPDSVAVLPVRHFSGALLSMEQSFERGYDWAGDTWEKRANLWAELSMLVTQLDGDRVIAVSYERICEEPDRELTNLVTSLGRLGYEVYDHDPAVLGRRYATYAEDPRRGLWVDGALSPIASVDLVRWSKEIAEEVWPIIRDADAALREWSKGIYKAPAALGQY